MCNEPNLPKSIHRQNLLLLAVNSSTALHRFEVLRCAGLPRAGEQEREDPVPRSTQCELVDRSRDSSNAECGLSVRIARSVMRTAEPSLWSVKALWLTSQGRLHGPRVILDGDHGFLAVGLDQRYS